MALKSGEERLKEMEAEMALFEQEVLGGPVLVSGSPPVMEAVPVALSVPAVPVVRPIIGTNTYRQVQQTLEARAASFVGHPPPAFVGPVPPVRPPMMRPAFVPHILQRPGGQRLQMMRGPAMAPPLPRPPPPPPMMLPPSLQGQTPQGASQSIQHMAAAPQDTISCIYGLPKIHKEGTPLRPMVSSINLVTYNIAKYVANILAPLVGNTPYYIRNSIDFMNKVRNLKMDPDETMVSYDVTSLFTCIPTMEALATVRERLLQDNTLQYRTNLKPDHIRQLLDLCLNTTYFQFNGKFYRQKHGCAMGSPVSPIVANLYMEEVEHKALNSFEGDWVEVCRELTMVQEKNDGINRDMVLPPIQQNRPALSWELKIKKKLKTVPACLGKFRPIVGRCCHQCTPDSLSKKLGQKSSLGFLNVLSVNETHTRYRGWLVRRVCCALFVCGCKVYASPASNRLERICQSNRVKEALTAEHKAPKGGDSQGQINRLSPFLPLINTCILPGLLRFMGWLMLKMFASIFDSVQVNLNHLPALHRASQEGSLLVYVYVRQSIMDCALIPLVLFCHNLRVPYTVCPLQINSHSLRSILQNVGVVLLSPSALTEQDAEMDHLYSPVMTSLVRELLHEGQAISIGVSVESGRGGQWLAHIRQLIKEGSVPDVSLVPVGISYDSVPKTNIQVGLSSVLRWLWSLFWKRPGGSVRIHLAQPFSLKEMCESGRCRVDEWLPLQDLLLPVILNNRTDSVFGQRRMSWLLPSSHYASELKEPTHPERDLSVAITLHLIFSVTSCMAVMATSLVSSLLLYRHRKGVSASLLCRDVAWLTEEVLFRNKDVGFGGSLVDVVHYSLSLLAPHLIMAAVPSRKDPVIVPRPSLAATLHLTLQAQTVTHTFILEAVGACAVSAMLCEVAGSGVSSRVRSSGVDGEEVRGDMEIDVVLCQSELTERALQLCHLLPPGFMPPCQSSHSFALDAVDSLVRCGILIMEEISKDVPICDSWKKEGTLNWTTTDDPYHSDSDCEEQDLRSYKLSQPSQCPEMLFFLCSMLAGHLRALCWTTSGLDLLQTPLPQAEFVAQMHSHLCDTANKKKQHYESCSEEAAHTAVRTLIDLGVLSEERQHGGVFLGVSPLFQLSENRQKLHRFISQYLYN